MIKPVIFVHFVVVSQGLGEPVVVSDDDFVMDEVGHGNVNLMLLMGLDVIQHKFIPRVCVFVQDKLFSRLKYNEPLYKRFRIFFVTHRRRQRRHQMVDIVIQPRSTSANTPSWGMMQVPTR